MVEYALRPKSLYLLHELAQMTAANPKARVISAGRDQHYEELVGAGLMVKTPCQSRCHQQGYAYTVTQAGMKLNDVILEGATSCVYF
jgi:hypothetical protein